MTTITQILISVCNTAKLERVPRSYSHSDTLDSLRNVSEVVSKCVREVNDGVRNSPSERSSVGLIHQLPLESR